MKKSRKLAIDILDEFENVLDTNNIMVPDLLRIDDPDEASLFGSTYLELMDRITELIDSASGGEICVSKN